MRSLRAVHWGVSATRVYTRGDPSFSLHHSHSCREVIAVCCLFFFFQAEDGIRDVAVTGVQTCALPIYRVSVSPGGLRAWPKDHPGAAAGGSPGELWTALDGADRLLDGGLSGAATAGGSDAGRCAGPGNQFGEHSEDRKSTRLNSSHGYIS